jgi:hypothetical protein
MRAEVDGCGVFVSFTFVDVEGDPKELGGIEFSSGSATFWLLFFFFAIAREVL